MTHKILYLTHTDILSDARILKTMTAARDAAYDTYGIGVTANDGSTKGRNNAELSTRSIDLRSRRLTFLPKAIRHTFSLLELTVKMGFDAVRSRPDIIHCNDTLVLPLGALVKLFTGARLIYDAHELESNRNGLSKPLSIATLTAEKWLWRFIDSLIVVSPSIEKWYHDNIGDKRSAIVLNSPALNDSDRQKSSYLRDRYNIPEEHKIFIYVGILGRGRGIDIILDAFRETARNATVVFMGYGEFAERLDKVSGADDRVHLHPAVPHEQVVEIAKSADFGLCLIENVSLSDYFSLPNKLFEYTFAGIPVIASDFPDIRQTVEQYGLGVCVDLDATSIMKTIDLIEEQGVEFKFRPQDLEALGWSAQTRKLLDLYDQTLSQSLPA